MEVGGGRRRSGGNPVSTFTRIALLTLGLWLAWPSAPSAQTTAPADFVEVYRLRIFNRAGGAIEASEDDGRTWRALGRVTRPAEGTTVGFNASRWGQAGTIVAAGANAVHVKVSDSGGRGVIFSLLPDGSPSAPNALATNQRGGTGIFGGRYGAFVGSPVDVERDGARVSIAGQVPRRDDVLHVTVRRPALYPTEIEFENRFGGIVRWRFLDGTEQPIAVVLRPVAGVGRFEGTQYVGIGRIRANHPGVIDISTSPPGVVGGFQIIPRDHAHSPELTNAILLTQWMVIGPLNPLDPSPQGTAPLFSSFLLPRHDPADLDDVDWMARMAERFLVVARLRGGPWGLMPPRSGRNDSALLDLTHFKILMPIWRR
jgi:hypothetical protein